MGMLNRLIGKATRGGNRSATTGRSRGVGRRRQPQQTPRGGLGSMARQLMSSKRRGR